LNASMLVNGMHVGDHWKEGEVGGGRCGDSLTFGHTRGHTQEQRGGHRRKVETYKSDATRVLVRMNGGNMAAFVRPTQTVLAV